MKTRLAFAVLLSAAFAAGACIAAGQQAAPSTPAATSAAVPAAQANRFAATVTPSERFELRGVLVERHGSGGRPLILIPGLASGSWVWQDTIRAFAGEHAVYVLTLPGFDGRPPAGAGPMANARAAVEELIASRHLDKPVIVGHSLGGTLAFAVAEDRPASVGGVVSIDGLPVMPGTEDMLATARSGAAGRIQASITGQKGDAFAAQQQSYMRTIGVLDMGKADDLARLSARSDPASTGLWAADDIALDLRPGLATITAPVLVLVPYFDLDATAQAGQQPITENVKLDYYRALMAGTPRLQVAAVSPARHFAMIDAPDKVIEAIRTFLKAL
jgi:pimeloyl-ACP methyl ester carboxylesterase